MRISHEAIYQSLFVQGRGALRRELTACLRSGRALRMPRVRTRRRGKTFLSPEIMISQRPAEAADRAVPGHWEGDLILGLGSSAIGTLVERTTRFTILLHLPGSVRARATAPWPTRVRLDIGLASRTGVDEDAVLGMRIGGGDRAAGAHRPGLSPVPLPHVRQAVQRALRHSPEPDPIPLRRHRARGALAPALQAEPARP